MDRRKLEEALDLHYAEIHDTILSRQNPVTGLLPASTAINAHGDYTDAWVRDNVYSILSVWALGQAYRKLDDSHPRAYLLSQSVVKLMRGLLMAMMGQANKVETFKNTGEPADALHAKYETHTGQPVVGDGEWGHLQLDATSLYLLMLAQMTASGLKIIFTLDEVCFIQNLVHYISRSYCTPDYGIWERGNKINHGIPEVNASSVGMAKAALESLSGFNLFGPQGGQDSVIHVVSSDIARARITLKGLLPRESNSKEVDAAVLSIIGYPAYAIEDENLVELTRMKIVDRLGGQYGCKRFLLDGHQTVLEDPSRLHYEPAELKQFEDIESEWPLFFTYLYLDGLCRSDGEQASDYREKLDRLFVEQDGHRLLPELYYVPAENVEAEKGNPGSQKRLPNENLPLVWAQSLYMVGRLLDEGLLHVSDIDPLRRRWNIGDVDFRQVMVPVLAQNKEVQTRLSSMGIFSETPEELAPLHVRHAEDLPLAYAELGRNEKLGLTGRPLHPMRSISSARLFLLAGERMVFVPDFLNPRSYLSLDTRLIDENFRTTLVYVNRHWNQPGQPLLSLLIRPDMLEEGYLGNLVGLLQEINDGSCSDVPVRTGRLSELLLTVTRERIDNLHGLKFNPKTEIRSPKVKRYLNGDTVDLNPMSSRELRNLIQSETSTPDLLKRLGGTRNIHEQIQLLSILAQRHELSEKVELTTDVGAVTTSLKHLVKDVFSRAGEMHCWDVIRLAAQILNRFDNRLEEAVTDIVIRHKTLVLGRGYAAETTVSSPLPQDVIVNIIENSTGGNPAEDILIHEVVLHIGQLIRFEPDWFDDLMTIRLWDLMQLVIAKISSTEGVSASKAYAHLLALPPHMILDHLRQLISQEDTQPIPLANVEKLRSKADRKLVTRAAAAEQLALGDEQDWREWRRHTALLGRIPDSIYERAWLVLQHSDAVVIGDKFNPQNRLDNGLGFSATQGERSFALEVGTLLQGVREPDYRQINIETLSALGSFFEANPDLTVDDDLVLDVIVGHAVRVNWLNREMGVESEYRQHRADAWDVFYRLAPDELEHAVQDAMLYLLEVNHSSATELSGLESVSETAEA